MDKGRKNLIWIEPPLASGGMAEVWRVITTGAEGVKNISVVKRILLNYAANVEFKKMFIDEAKITSQLHKPTPHPNIIQVLEFQQFDDEYLLFIEYVNGPDIRRILTACGKNRIRFPVVFSLHIITEALNGLYHAHNLLDSSGSKVRIVHRDISPQNILVSYGGDVKIIDWGIADAKMKTTETVVGVIKGKYGYMSPEQANAEKLDYQTDIFSAAIVLWEMLTGRRLFVHENDLKTLKRIQKAQIPDPRKYNPDVSENLSKIVLKALLQKKESRYVDTLELIKVLTQERNRVSPDFSKLQLSRYLQKLFEKDIKKDALIIKQAEAQTPSNEPPKQGGTTTVKSKNKSEKFTGKRRKDSKEDIEREIILSEVKESGLELDIDEETASSLGSYTPTPFDTIQKSGFLAAMHGKKSFSKGFKTIIIVMGMLFFLMVAGLLLLKDKPRFDVKRDQLFGKIRINPASGRTLEIETPLRGLTVKVAGLTYEKTSPETLKIEDLPYQSSYFVEISKTGYETLTDLIEIKDNTKYILPIKKMIPLPDTGNLLVETSPREANVYVDGAKREGTTPLTLNLALGTMFEIDVRRHGYYDENFKIKLNKPDELVEKKIILKPKENNYRRGKIPAIAKIDSTPPGANVYIDSDFVCKTPCIYKDGFINDVINIDIARKGYKKFFIAFPLKLANNYLNPTLEALESINSYITVFSDPSGYVYINDKPTYKKTPLIKFKVARGTHKISVKRRGKLTTKNITVGPGDHIRVKIVNK